MILICNNFINLVIIGRMGLKRSLNFVYVFLLFCYYLPFGKGCGPSFEQP